MLFERPFYSKQPLKEANGEALAFVEILYR
jgi:hypothetical protein